MLSEATLSRSRDLFGLAAFLVLCLGVGGVGSLSTASSIAGWYQELAKPAFNPLDWVFAPVWTLLYVTIGIAGWRVWRRGALRGWAGTAYAAQLVLNLIWPFLFFGLRSPGVALIEVALLLAAVVWTLFLFLRVDRLAGALLVPYAIWVAFALLLNAAIWRLN